LAPPVAADNEAPLHHHRQRLGQWVARRGAAALAGPRAGVYV